MAIKRIYVVTEGEEGDGTLRVRLVNAVSKAAALAHVVQPKYLVEIAKVQDVAFLMREGVDVEEAQDAMLPPPTLPLPAVGGKVVPPGIAGETD
jgi:hypothetical protein